MTHTVFSPLSANTFHTNYVFEFVAMLQVNQLLRDPLGNDIRLPLWMFLYSDHDYNIFSQIITEPAFIIRVKDESLYFIRLINWNVNMLLEVKLIENEFVVSSYIENPTTEYISDLLKSGSLISFQ